jgi:hypothetical protein
LTELAFTPEHVQAIWRYAIALLLIDGEYVRVVESHQDGETLHLFLHSRDGDRFEVVRPPITEEAEKLLLQRVRYLAASGDRDLGRRTPNSEFRRMLVFLICLALFDVCVFAAALYFQWIELPW